MNYQNPYYQYQMPLAQMQNQPQNVVQPQPQPQPQPQMQSAFIPVSSIEEVYKYPVAPGNVVSFKISDQPYICEKSQGYSQFESPVVKTYKLIEENIPQDGKEEKVEYALKSDIDDLNDYLAEIEAKVNALIKPTRTTRKKKSEEVDDDEE